MIDRKFTFITSSIDKILRLAYKIQSLAGAASRRNYVKIRMVLSLLKKKIVIYLYSETGFFFVRNILIPLSI